MTYICHHCGGIVSVSVRLVGSKVEKLYIEDGGETAYELSWWMFEASDRDTPVNIELQKTEKNSECMWCLTHEKFIERGEKECGMHCKGYNPCNGYSGRGDILKTNTRVSRSVAKRLD